MMRAVLRPAPPLFLFDIDGTLIRKAGNHHRQALVDAVRVVTGLETTTEQIPLQGMLDRDILAWMLRDAGASASLIRRSMPAIMEEAQNLYAGTCPNLRARTCPGVRRFLDRVRRRAIRSGLVTGNLSRIGWMKMEKAGLRRHFEFGAFAEEGKDRATLVAKAIRQARREGWITRDSSITLFGDHFNDILAAKANGIQSVAIATGVLSADELRRHQPDLLLPDLTGCTIDRILPE